LTISSYASDLHRYEMYAGDSKTPGQITGDSHVLHPSPSSHNVDSDPPPASDSGPALEVIEMANGETIWFVLVQGDSASV